MPNTSPFEYHSALRYSSDELAQILCHCFENYIVRFVIDGDTFARRFGAEDLSLNDSIIVTHQQQPVALALISRRGLHSRVSALSIRPEMRGKGLGKALMKRIVADARERGDRQLSLEVIEGNDPAITLYHQAGLQIVRTLTGHLAGEQTAGDIVPLQEIDPLFVSHRLIADGATDLPWLIAPESLFKLPGKPYAFALEQHQAYAVVQVGADKCFLRMIYVPPQHRLQGHARAMLAALQTKFASLPLTANVYVPEVAAPFFARLGWQQDALRQFEMTMTLGTPQ
ncbi:MULTISPECIES: GNAT family N-acetyltransferase [Serratia]|uniref:Ribosomal-protein-alanine N-acetyltransferase n=1 Tax=Serratia quinivorans TaxID=137545 RepID=A0A379YNU9_9GAMM|nr:MULTISPECIES: GNAT family N-acetyltransferase [Serratia]QBX66295.1 GNAT family N-acetyltransferase [Serratia quinivorans]RYM61566.1 GNAT family N-acetyltransferase [Serratia proteamaculans]CAI1788125.1 ribosomal-protein-alanine N-acetyltransferase [Serratia quinivorans]SUI47203.1 ribosomal-protein-alanine N-acetyltransferase [Serratia quinivorans]